MKTAKFHGSEAGKQQPGKFVASSPSLKLAVTAVLADIASHLSLTVYQPSLAMH